MPCGRVDETSRACKTSTFVWGEEASGHKESRSRVCAHISHCLFPRVCTTTTYLSSAKACAITMGSDTSPHVLRFTGFDHRRERRRLEQAFLTNAAATVRSVGAM